MHLAYGAVSALGVLAVAAAIIGTIGFAALSRYLIPDQSGWLLGGILLVEVIASLVLMIVAMAICLPFLATGYALLKKKSWVKYSAIAAIVVSITAFPVGTILSAYTIWHLFSGREEGSFAKSNEGAMKSAGSDQRS
jgi:hypothetical protein